MSLSVSANAAHTPLPQPVPAVPAAPLPGNSNILSLSSVIDTVSLGNAVASPALAYGISNAAANGGTAALGGSASSATVNFGNGGVPAGNVPIPTIAPAVGDGATTGVIDQQSTDTTLSVSGSGNLADESGTRITQTESIGITDIAGSASVSLSSDLSGVQAQSLAGIFTLQLGRALKADTVADPTTGALSLTKDGKADLLKTVTQLLLARNFTADEAASGAQALADAIDGSGQAITLSLQHQGTTDQSQSAGGAIDSDTALAGADTEDDQDSENIAIALDPATGNLSVNLHTVQTDEVAGAGVEHEVIGADLANDAEGEGVATGPGLVDPEATDVQSAPGAVLQESASVSRFISNHTTITDETDDGRVSLQFSADSSQGRLLTQDEAALPGLASIAQNALDKDTANASSFERVFQAGQNATVAPSPPAPAGPGPGRSAASHGKGTTPALANAVNALHARSSPFLSDLAGVLKLLQSVPPEAAPSQAGAKPASTDPGNLQSLSTDQEQLSLNTTGLTDTPNGATSFTQNNAYLAALYEKPSTAASSLQVSA